MAGHSTSGFSDRVQNSWFHQLWQVVQVLKLQSSSRPSHYHHYVWLLVWCSFYEMLCWFYVRCNGTHTLQKVQLLSHQSTEYLPKSLGDNQYIFWQMWDGAFVFFLVSSGFCLGTLPWMPFLPSLFLIVESWTLTLIEASEACSSFRCFSGFFYDLLDESSLRSWSNFGRPATPWKVHHCSEFSPFVDNGSDHSSLESQSLRNGFITISRLIYVNYFVSHFFRSWHDVSRITTRSVESRNHWNRTCLTKWSMLKVLFKHASLCQTGSISVISWFNRSGGIQA